MSGRQHTCGRWQAHTCFRSYVLLLVFSLLLCFHTRVILRHVQDNSYVVVTPDFDIYVEDLQSDVNNAAVRFCLADNQLPHGIDPNEVYASRRLRRSSVRASSRRVLS